MGTQRPLNRRQLLIALTALSQLPGCAKRDRSAVLEGLVREVLGAMTRDLLADSRRLQAELRALLEAPTAARLAAARLAFKQAIVSWKRAGAFRAGPFAASQAFQHAAFWPARAGAVDAVLASAGAIDEPRVEALGVDAKGLFALEYLLFQGSQGVSLDAAGAAGERARDYAFELSSNVLGYASRVKRLFGDGRAYAQSFGAKGQHSVEELVAQSLDTLDILLGKLARVARARLQSTPLWSAVEGYFSQTSLEIVRALLDGTRRLYLGGADGGLSELVARSSPPIDEHVREAFATADAALVAVREPLELALVSDPERFRRANGALEQLKHVMKTEMASALEG